MNDEIRILTERIDLLHALMLGLVTAQEDINNRQREINVELIKAMTPNFADAWKAGLN